MNEIQKAFGPDSLITFFDPINIDHLEAYRHLQEVGSWPAPFWAQIAHLDKPTSWQMMLTAKIADQYLIEKLGP